MKIPHSEIEAKTLYVFTPVRYWEDATVNGIEDKDGSLIPGHIGKEWLIAIDIDTGIIINWPKGTTASVHYKVCDEGTYIISDGKDTHLTYKDSYVPNLLNNGEGWGDYIILEIDENGKIEKWDPHRFIKPSEWETKNTFSEAMNKNINNLQIIGYTGHLPESMRPGYVAGVFEDSESHVILIAPYDLKPDQVVGATCIDRSRFNELVAKGSIKELEQPISALPEYVLWQDVDGNLQYDEAYNANDKLQEISVREIVRAKKFLNEKLFDEAQKSAGIAFSAQPNTLTYALMALCHQAKNETGLAEFCRVLAINSGISGVDYDDEYSTLCQFINSMEWIDATKELPPQLDNVFAFCGNRDEVVIAYFTHGQWRLINNEDGTQVRNPSPLLNITHWMAIPKKP